jgi:hypothetical protein
LSRTSSDEKIECFDLKLNHLVMDRAVGETGAAEHPAAAQRAEVPRVQELSDV